MSNRRATGVAIWTTGMLLFGMLPDGAGQTRSSRHPELPRSVRVYVLDCGTLENMDPGRFQLTKDEVNTNRMSVSCFLVAHPKGTLMWDAGAVPDMAWKPAGFPVKYHLVLPGSQERDLTLRKSLREQLAQAGYAPADVTYLAFSHYHYDHTANANAFATATWLVRQAERDGMFSSKPPELTQPADYAALRKSRTATLVRDEHDVFGDGTVVIKFAPGHTPGHQMLYLKLAKTGGSSCPATCITIRRSERSTTSLLSSSTRSKPGSPEQRSMHF